MLCARCPPHHGPKGCSCGWQSGGRWGSRSGYSPGSHRVPSHSPALLPGTDFLGRSPALQGMGPDGGVA